MLIAEFPKKTQAERSACIAVAAGDTECRSSLKERNGHNNFMFSFMHTNIQIFTGMRNKQFSHCVKWTKIKGFFFARLSQLVGLIFLFLLWICYHPDRLGIIVLLLSPVYVSRLLSSQQMTKRGIVMNAIGKKSTNHIYRNRLQKKQTIRPLNWHFVSSQQHRSRIEIMLSALFTQKSNPIYVFFSLICFYWPNLFPSEFNFSAQRAHFDMKWHHNGTKWESGLWTEAAVFFFVLLFCLT